MTLGTLKCTTIEDDASPANSITVADLTTLDTDKADLASPTFTGTVTVPATVAFTQNASDVTIPDNQGLALEVKEGDNAYITFDTTNSAEQVEVHKNLQLDEDLTFSAAKVISFPDDNANALRFREGENNYLRFNTDNGNERVITEKQLDAHDNIAILAQGELQLADTDSNRHIALRCTGDLTNTSTWTLPADTPEAGDVLTVTSVADTHNPTLEWAAAATGGANTFSGAQAVTPSVQTDAGALDMDASNFIEVSNVSYNTEPTGKVVGTSGLFYADTAAPTNWHAQFKFVSGGYVAPTTFPAVAPWYIAEENEILVGAWTEGISVAGS